MEVQAGYVFEKELVHDPVLISEIMADPASYQLLARWISTAESMCFDSHESLEKMTRELAAREGVQAAALVHPLRFAISGTKVTPGLFELMTVIGKETCLNRIKNLIQKAGQPS